MYKPSRIVKLPVSPLIATCSKISHECTLTVCYKSHLFFQRKMKFIAKSAEGCEKAKEWLHAHAYPAVCTWYFTMKVLWVATTGTLVPLYCE